MPDTKNRRIKELEKKVYAPLSSLGDVICDEDAVYIEIKKKEENIDIKKESGESVLETLKNMKQGIDYNTTKEDFKLFDNSFITPSQINEINKFNEIKQK